MKFDGTWTTTKSAAPTWARDIRTQRACEAPVPWGSEAPITDWRIADERLRANSKARSGLDANELALLPIAECLQVWKPFGMVSLLDYMERVLGYPPRTAQDRIRVARALVDLPQIAAALARDELKFSAVRELCRVATQQTEAAWLERATGKNVREVEEMVSGHQPGDLPDDPPDPDLKMHKLELEVRGATYALYRQARTLANDEHGTNLDEDRFVEALCSNFLETKTSGEARGRAKYQIALTVCQRCDQAWQLGSGVAIAIDAATLDRARCDAVHIGSLDAETPDRAHQEIPPSVVRFIWQRDGERCQTPGCRSSRGIEIHHIKRRADGGTNETSNLTLRCSACHDAHHTGKITISGTAPGNLHVERHLDPKPAPTTHVRAAKSLDTTITRTQARDALVSMGWKPAVARAAIEEACAQLGDKMQLEILIFEALRRCPKPLA